jgi:uncharacterized protein
LKNTEISSNSKNPIIGLTEEFVFELLKEDFSGHDFEHIQRVRRFAVVIAKKEGADLEIVELASLLHDISDWKFNGGDLELGSKLAHEWLLKNNYPKERAELVAQIIKNVSYKGAKVESKQQTIEGKIVQDADRLDALGAVGIGRAFAYGGMKKRKMYDPKIVPIMHASFEEYKNNENTTINHFYEKLFLLEEKMNTKSAKELAREKTKFMKEFVERFLDEWSRVK